VSQSIEFIILQVSVDLPSIKFELVFVGNQVALFIKFPLLGTSDEAALVKQVWTGRTGHY
jgi:hypothetical protein